MKSFLNTFFYCTLLCSAFAACSNEVEETKAEEMTSGIDRIARQVIKSRTSVKDFESTIANHAWKVCSIAEINLEESQNGDYVVYDDGFHRVSGTVATDFYLNGNCMRVFVSNMAFADLSYIDYSYSYEETTGGIFVDNGKKSYKDNFAYMYIDKLEEQNLYTITRLEFDAVPHYYYCHYVMMNDEELDTALKTHTYEIK